jgi:tetratricopeptide (TPR) repeat protein
MFLGGYQARQEGYSSSDVRLELQLLGKQIDKKHRPYDKYVERGNLFCRIGAYSTALKDYTSAIALDPQKATAFRGRALAYSVLGMPSEAINDYSQSIQMEPGLAWPYFGRGCWLFFGQYYQAAASDFSAYLSRVSEDEFGGDRMLFLSLVMQGAEPEICLDQVSSSTQGLQSPSLLLIYKLFNGDIDPEVFREAHSEDIEMCSVNYVLGQYYKHKKCGEKAGDAFLRVLFWGTLTDYEVAGAREELKRPIKKNKGQVGAFPRRSHTPSALCRWVSQERRDRAIVLRSPTRSTMSTSMDGPGTC